MMMKRIPLLQSLVAASGLILLLACAGHRDAPVPPKATGLDYTDPAGTGWRLVKSPASTSTHLVLELKAPATAAGLGVGFKLTVDPATAQWAKVAAADATYVKNAAYDLGSDTTSQLLKAKASGGELAVGAYQKGTAHPVTYGGAIISVAMDFKTSSTLNAGTVIPLAVAKAQHVGADGSNVDIQPLLQVGTLKGK